MAIPDETLDEVRHAADIVEVVSDYVRLKKSGSRYKGLCPFHNEKTPSFSVDPQNNLYYCFGCQRGGDVFRFVQEIEGVGFMESVRLLADRFGIPLPDDTRNPEAANRKEACYRALRFAARHFYKQLTQTAVGEPALAYLKDRGFTPKTIKRFGLGYAPDRWDGLLEAAAEASIAPDVLEDAGLVLPRKRGDGHYDRYRGRVIFPIFSHIGKVVGFAGRVLDRDSDQPKYINSPETDVYHKSKVLYGLRQAKRAIRDVGEVLVVEGYTDVIALHQAGVQHAVATCGTALMAQQISILDRFAQRVLLLYDADAAGARAAERGLDLILDEGLGAYVVQLPDGEDPDSYVRAEGADAFRAYVAAERQDLPAFLYDRAEREGRLDTPEDRVDVQRAIMTSIAKIDDENLRREYVQRASDVLAVPDAGLFRMMENAREEQHSTKQRRAAREQSSGPGGTSSRERPDAPPAEDRTMRPEEHILLRVMLEGGAPLIKHVMSHLALSEFTEGPPRTMARHLLEMYQAGDVQTDRFAKGAFGPKLQSLATAVLADEHEPSANWSTRDVRVPRLNEHPTEAANSSMKLLKLDRVDEAIDACRATTYQTTNPEEVRRLQERLSALLQLKRKIKAGAFLNSN
ncbi:DNA primase [Salisaeta longa]|uniref:DNA primase n=1 Tax=Salisaeta longa TaxID=503170 RepID=UPI0003B62463|nr:DNA primase [Salisaeta longa]